MRQGLYLNQLSNRNGEKVFVMKSSNASNFNVNYKTIEDELPGISIPALDMSGMVIVRTKY